MKIFTAVASFLVICMVTCFCLSSVAQARMRSTRIEFSHPAFSQEYGSFKVGVYFTDEFSEEGIEIPFESLTIIDETTAQVSGYAFILEHVSGIQWILDFEVEVPNNKYMYARMIYYENDTPNASNHAHLKYPKVGVLRVEQ